MRFAEVGGEGGQRLDFGGGEHGVFGPASCGGYVGAGFEVVGGGGDDLGDGAGAHWLAHVDRGDVEAVGGDGGADPASLGRVVRKVEDF